MLEHIQQGLRRHHRPQAWYDVFRSGRLPEEVASVLRLKRFTDREGKIIGLIEGALNNNMQTFGADGYAKRSTHAANMAPSGTIGALISRGPGDQRGAHCLQREAQPPLSAGTTSSTST
jgi:hypothetical protein